MSWFSWALVGLVLGLAWWIVSIWWFLRPEATKEWEDTEMGDWS